MLADSWRRPTSAYTTVIIGGIADITGNADRVQFILGVAIVARAKIHIPAVGQQV